MTATLILLAVLATPYIVLNVWRVRHGRRWAVTFCQLAKEWEEREHARRLALRAEGSPGRRAAPPCASAGVAQGATTSSSSASRM